MHGIIFAELKKFVGTRLGDGAWDNLMRESGLGAKVYLAAASYPDTDAVALVTTASRITGLPAMALLEDFGEFIVPDLVQMYGALLDPTWRTLDTIEKTENTIHSVVRMRNKGAEPPQLKVTRTGPDEVVLEYSSARKMCGVAKGISRGLAKHFGERIVIDEKSCMHQGAPRCDISIRKG